MSLLEKLNNDNSLYSNLNGVSPNIPIFRLSTLHDQYSIINNPIADRVTPRNGDILPQPSELRNKDVSRDTAPTPYNQPSE
jgi:hypothetical protein